MVKIIACIKNKYFSAFKLRCQFGVWLNYKTNLFCLIQKNVSRVGSLSSYNTRDLSIHTEGQADRMTWLIYGPYIFYLIGSFASYKEFEFLHKITDIEVTQIMKLFKSFDMIHNIYILLYFTFRFKPQAKALNTL